jgi:hypothetical protein
MKPLIAFVALAFALTLSTGAHAQKLPGLKSNQ